VGDLQLVDERVAQADLVRDRVLLEVERADHRGLRGLRVARAGGPGPGPGAQRERGDERGRDHAAILLARMREKRASAAPWSWPASSPTWSRLSFWNTRRRSSRTRAISLAKVPRTSALPASTRSCAPVSGSSSSTSPSLGNLDSSGSEITTGT